MYERTRGDRAKGQGEGIENKWVRDSAIFRWCRVFRLADSALSSALLSSTDPQFPHPTFSTLCFSFTRREWPILLVAMGPSVRQASSSIVRISMEGVDWNIYQIKRVVNELFDNEIDVNLYKILSNVQTFFFNEF